jgi:hypothetical protein
MAGAGRASVPIVIVHVLFLDHHVFSLTAGRGEGLTERRAAPSPWR